MQRHLTAAALSIAAALVSLWLLGTGAWSVALAITSVPLTYIPYIRHHRPSEGGEPVPDDKKIPLDCKVMRGQSPRDSFQVTLDPEDHEALQAELERWLADNKWHKGLWGGFRLEVRRTDGYKVIKTVRVRGDS